MAFWKEGSPTTDITWMKNQNNTLEGQGHGRPWKGLIDRVMWGGIQTGVNTVDLVGSGISAALASAKANGLGYVLKIAHKAFLSASTDVPGKVVPAYLPNDRFTTFPIYDAYRGAAQGTSSNGKANWRYQANLFSPRVECLLADSLFQIGAAIRADPNADALAGITLTESSQPSQVAADLTGTGYYAFGGRDRYADAHIRIGKYLRDAFAGFPNPVKIIPNINWIDPNDVPSHQRIADAFGALGIDWYAQDYNAQGATHGSQYWSYIYPQFNRNNASGQPLFPYAQRWIDWTGETEADNIIGSAQRAAAIAAGGTTLTNFWNIIYDDIITTWHCGQVAFGPISNTTATLVVSYLVTQAGAPYLTY